MWPLKLLAGWNTSLSIPAEKKLRNGAPHDIGRESTPARLRAKAQKIADLIMLKFEI